MICGLWMPPAARMTSLLACTVVVPSVPFVAAVALTGLFTGTNVTPVAVVPSRTILVTLEPVMRW